jgi:hypothetical protein
MPSFQISKITPKLCFVELGEVPGRRPGQITKQARDLASLDNVPSMFSPEEGVDLIKPTNPHFAQRPNEHLDHLEEQQTIRFLPGFLHALSLRQFKIGPIKYAIIQTIPMLQTDSP